MPDVGTPKPDGEPRPFSAVGGQLDELIATLADLSRASRWPGGQDLLTACPVALRHIRASLDRLAEPLEAGRGDLLARRWEELHALVSRVHDQLRRTGETGQRAAAEIDSRTTELDAASKLPPTRELAERLRDLTAAMGQAAHELRDDLDSLGAAARNAARRAAIAGARTAAATSGPRPDPETGLTPRELFDERLALTVATGAFRGPWSFLLADVDSQEDITRRHGVGPCEMLLKRIAQRLGQCVQQSSPAAGAAAYGEGRFAAILPGEPANTLGTADQLRLAIAAVTWSVTSLQGKRDISTTASIGVAPYRRGEALANLTRRASDAVSQSRAQGANRVVQAER